MILETATALGIGGGIALAIWYLRRTRSFLFWAGFALQVFIAVFFQVADDVASRFVAYHGAAQGIANAHRLVAFEAAHGFWVEPAWQTFFQHTHRVLLLTVHWSQVMPLMDDFYIWGHLLVTLVVAMWVYVYRRRFFPLVRNTCIIVNALALVLYHTVPVAPPRLTPGLTFQHHAFAFQDTVFGKTTVVGGYYHFNEFAAIPSVHISWALIVATAVIFLVRHPLVKLLAACYPFLVLTVIVVTGNHYLLDAAAGAGVAIAAACCALGLEWVKGKASHFRRAGAGGAAPAPGPAQGAGAQPETA